MKRVASIISILFTTMFFAQESDSIIVYNEIEKVVLIGEKKSQLNKLNIRKIESPMTINTINSKTLQIRNTSTIEEALKNATGVRVQNIYGGFNQTIIRGFSDTSFLIDGIRDERTAVFSSPMTNLANVERIEILKGPESILYGHSILGGAVNIIRKKPSANTKGEAKFSYGSYDLYNISMRVGGAFSDNLKYRFDFGSTKTEGWRDISENTNNGSLVLEYTPSRQDVIELTVQINNDKFDTDTGVPTDANVLGEVKLLEGVNRKTRYGDSGDGLKHKAYNYQLRYTRDINNKIKFYNTTSYVDDRVNYISNDGVYIPMKVTI